MDIRNLALVRATNVIPFDGVVRPVSEVPYLDKEKGTDFSFAMMDLLKKKGLLKEVDYTKPDEISKVNKYNNDILNQYMPYSSDYNSMVLWSINGLVPDDINNTFSDKTCAIIEGLEEQIDQSEIISLVPTDAAIKGNINLSKQATILISKERYESLSQDQKDKISKLEMNITIFEGNLKENVDKQLTKEGRYTSETLSLRREDDGYIKSDTSDEVRETVNSVASKRNIAQVLHYNVITGDNDELDKLKSVKNEFKSGVKVKDFYKKAFFEYLFSKMDIENSTKAKAYSLPDSMSYMQDLCSEIERIGLDKYKSIVSEYNKALEDLKDKGQLPTPQEIVDSIREKQKIDLVMKIEQNGQDKVLASGIEATEEITRKETIDEQKKKLEELTKQKNEKEKGAEIE